MSARTRRERFRSQTTVPSGRARQFVEIERKFLVRRLPDGLRRYPCRELAQGYVAIAADGTEVRVRRDGARRLLTIKSGRGRTRTEVELEIAIEDFTALWKLTAGRRLRKRRYRIPHQKALMELDVFHGRLRGLKTVEVEFPSKRAGRGFRPPPWFGGEITDDDRYRNQNLASHGLPRPRVRQGRG